MNNSVWVDKITDVVLTIKDELDSGHELPNHSGVGEEEIPVIGMSFGSLPLAHKFYANYAKKVGFVTKIRNTNFDKAQKESKIPVNQSIYCTREAYQESRVNAATRANRITATRCRARMYVILDKEKGSWVVSRLELRHSHPCSAKKAVHYHEYRKLTMHAKCVITDNDEAQIRPNKTYLALANEVGGSSNLGFSEKDVRNYITRNLRYSDDNEDFQGMMNYFVRMKEINPNFFYAIDVDDANKFRSALWVDARCRVSYEYYEDVVSIDTTYRKQICILIGELLGLPFASFVGVNYHGKSTLLGCALLGSEEIPSFEWVFTQWVKCVGTMPREIITDQCKAMAGAIRKVLPDTVHRWCIWHIMKKSQFKLSGYARYEELNAMMNHIVWNSPSTESFEVDWAGFVKQFNLGQNRWLTYLYANRRKWVLIFFKSEFWAGMRSTQRSESMHAFYGGYLHCKSGVHTVPSCYVLPRWSKNVIRKHTYIKSSHDVARSDESNNLFRHLCSEFYNVAQEFIACDEEAAILQAALWEAKSKLTDYRASMRSTTVAATQNTMPTQSTGGAIVHDIPGPSRPKDD
ncbi:protein FAR-RED IMPAIRED RESPONSE 1-like [Arachis ipaensis]|uniref:protein FAR-RED IMPAIRED RESPONSE 1-like n=1 Tax=Arachis ipaensis TaxID=130454 RepID=UPI0007AF3398|nr:protein FAR-RED IMPAIRED RESPONSE 1-like [Arachis ipaensis]